MTVSISGSGGITYPDGSTNSTRSASVAGDTFTGDIVLSGSTLRRTMAADGTFLQLKSSYSGNPNIFEVSQTSSDGYVYVRDATGVYVSTITGYPYGNASLRGRIRYPDQPLASVTLNAQTTTSGGIFTTGTLYLNNGSCWNNSTHRFTAPVAGHYMVISTAYTNYSSGYGYCSICKNGASQLQFHFNNGGYVIHQGMGHHMALELAAGDYIDFRRSGVGTAYYDLFSATIQLVA